jgi:LacI family transcriptional regulator
MRIKKVVLRMALCMKRGLMIQNDTEIRIGCHIPRTLPYGGGLLRGIMEWSRERMNVRVHNYTHFAEMRLFAPHGIIALLGTVRAQKAADTFSIPVVNVSAGRADIPYPTVTVDNVAVGQLGAEHLLATGLECFAFARDPWAYFSDLRQRGFEGLIPKRGKTLCPAYVRQEGEESLTPDGYPHPPGLEPWLRALPRPCGIMADTEDMARALLSAAGRCGIRIPEDVAVVTADQNDWICDLSNPPLSCVPIMGEEVGRRAANLLMDLLGGDPPPEAPILIPPGPVGIRQSSDLLQIPNETVCRAIRFIRTHAHQPMDVPQIVRAAGINRRSLEILFRRYRKRSILEEVNLAHFHVARQLLLDTRLPMADVCERSGFANVQRMTLVFKKETGQTPLVYRKSHAPG